MARRKSYRGTPKEHAYEAGRAAVLARRELTAARRSISKNNCAAALYDLRHAEHFAGSYSTHNRNRAQPLVSTRARVIRGTALNRALAVAWGRFYQKCVTK